MIYHLERGKMNYYPINMSQHTLSDVVFFQGELKWNDGTIPIIETGKGDIRICYDYDVDFTDLTDYYNDHRFNRLNRLL